MLKTQLKTTLQISKDIGQTVRLVFSLLVLTLLTSRISMLNHVKNLNFFNDFFESPKYLIRYNILVSLIMDKRLMRMRNCVVRLNDPLTWLPFCKTTVRCRSKQLALQQHQEKRDKRLTLRPGRQTGWHKP